jgi:hypothetical protein
VVPGVLSTTCDPGPRSRRNPSTEMGVSPCQWTGKDSILVTGELSRSGDGALVVSAGSAACWWWVLNPKQELTSENPARTRVPRNTEEGKVGSSVATGEVTPIPASGCLRPHSCFRTANPRALCASSVRPGRRAVRRSLCPPWTTNWQPTSFCTALSTPSWGAWWATRWCRWGWTGARFPARRQGAGRAHWQMQHRQGRQRGLSGVGRNARFLSS